MSDPASRRASAAPVWIALVVGLGLGLGLALFFLGGSPAADSPAVSAPAGGDAEAAGAGFGGAIVDVTPVEEIVAAEPVQLLGSAAPARQSLVAAEVDGLVAELQVDEGDVVSRGAVLVRLRTTGVQQQLDAAEASRQESQARLQRAAAEFERLASLRDRQAISEREYDQAVADRDALVQANLRLDAEISRLREQLDGAVVRAPFGGQVVEVRAEVGEWIGRGDAIATLVDLSTIEVTVQVAERYISAVRPGFAVDVGFDALPGELRSGEVSAVVPQAVAEARTFPVLVRVDNADGRIKGGMAARVIAQLGYPEPSLIVPKDALVRRGEQVSVYRLATGPFGAPAAQPAEPGPGMQGMVEAISVEIGPARGAWQTVYGALQAGDLVIVRGNERIFPGMPGEVREVRRFELPTADPDRPIAVDPRQGESR